MRPDVRLADLAFPARDERFDTLVGRLSEPPAGPRGDNLVSNEDSYPRAAGELARRVAPGGVYLGVGPDQNFTLAAATGPAIAFVVDYRRRNLLVHLLQRSLILLSTDRASYLARLTARDPGVLRREVSAPALVQHFLETRFEPDRLAAARAEVRRVLEPLGVVRPEEWAEFETIQARLAGPGLNARFLALTMYPTAGRLITTPDRDERPAHWLATDDRYQAVRSLHAGDRFVPLVGDFAGGTCLSRLGAWLRERSLRVATCYVSDVEFFLLRAGRFDAYLANLGRLPWAQGACVVRTSTREIDHPARVKGDSSTTVVEPAADFLARGGAVRTPDDLFRIE